MYENWMGFAIIYVEATVTIAAIWMTYRVIKCVKKKMKRRYTR